VVISSSTCPLWAAPFELNAVLVGTSCISAFLTMESVPPASQPNGTEGKMMREKLVFYCGNCGSLCQKLHKDTRKRQCVWDTLA